MPVLLCCIFKGFYKIRITALVEYFIKLKVKELKLTKIPSLLPGATDPLLKYHWPGNIRELQNVIERALILNPTGPITFEHLVKPIEQHLQKIEIQNQKDETRNLEEIISEHICKVLSKTNGRINGQGGAAEMLGINANTLRNRMNKLGIEYKTKQ